MALVPHHRPFVSSGEALGSALTALKAAKPILDSIAPAEGQAPDPELARARQQVDRAISQVEIAR